MDVLTLARVMLRRWYVVVPVLVVTAAVIVFVGLRQGATMTTDGSMLIAPPDLQSSDAEGAPVSASDVAAPSVLAAVMTDDEIVDRVVDNGGSPRYTVTPTGEHGLLRVTALGDSEQEATETVSLVLAEIQSVSERRQEEADIASEERIDVTVLSEPAVAVETTLGGTVQYEATGAARLTGRFGAENPYQDVRFTFAVLQELAVSDQGQTSLADAGATEEFEMQLDESIVRLSVTGDGAAAVEQTYDVVVSELSDELETRQASLGIPTTQRTRLEPLAQPIGATPDTSGLVRPLLTLAVLGGVAAVALALLADNVTTALAARTRHEPGDPIEIGTGARRGARAAGTGPKHADDGAATPTATPRQHKSKEEDQSSDGATPASVPEARAE